MTKVQLPEGARPAAFGKFWLKFSLGNNEITYPLHFITLKTHEGYETIGLELVAGGCNTDLRLSITDMLREVILLINDGGKAELSARASEDLVPDFWALYRKISHEALLNDSRHSKLEQTLEMAEVLKGILDELKRSRIEVLPGETSVEILDEAA